MCGWNHEVGRDLDAKTSCTFLDVHKPTSCMYFSCINASNNSSLHLTFSNLEEVVFHMNDLLRRVTRKPVKYTDTGASTRQLCWSSNREMSMFKGTTSSLWIPRPLYIDLINWEQFGRISSTFINQGMTCGMLFVFCGVFKGQKAVSRSFRGCIAVLGQGVTPWKMVTHGHSVVKLFHQKNRVLLMCKVLAARRCIGKKPSTTYFW